MIDLSSAKWRKNTHNDSNSQYVEWATFDGVVAVRDSKDPDGPALVFTADEWRAFVGGVKDDEADL